jgi:hypothetical protein
MPTCTIDHHGTTYTAEYVGRREGIADPVNWWHCAELDLWVAGAIDDPPGRQFMNKLDYQLSMENH